MENNKIKNITKVGIVIGFVIIIVGFTSCWEVEITTGVGYLVIFLSTVAHGICEKHQKIES